MRPLPDGTSPASAGAWSKPAALARANGPLLAGLALAGCIGQDLNAIQMPPYVDAGGSVQDVAGPPEDAGAGPQDAGTPPKDGSAAATGRKRGIAYGGNSDGDLAALSPGISWWYNWSPQPDSTLSKSYAASGVDFVPMIWGGNFDPITLAAQVPAGAKYLLTFNEPESGSQSNLTPAQAAALWPKIETFAKSRNLMIVSPGVNYCAGNCNTTDPFVWLDQFFAACMGGCQVDYIAAHWYACTKSALQTTLAKYEAKYNRPLWITEFSCLDAITDGGSVAAEAQEEQYLQDSVAVLEADPMVFRYAWFTGRFTKQPAVDLLGANSGVLTPLGQKYISLPMAP
jgi:hypothetical protein